MTKKKSKIQKKQNKPNVAPPKGSAAELNTKLTLRTWLMGRTVVTLTGPTVLASYAIYVYFQGEGTTQQAGNSWADAILIAMVIFSLILLLFVMSVDVVAKASRIKETVEQRNLRWATILKLSTIYVTVIFYSLALRQGYLEGFAVFLKARIFPAFSDGVNYILSNIVGWAVSGVVGNFVYDLLKRLFADKKEKSPSVNKPPSLKP